MENPTLTTEQMVEGFKRPFLDRLYDLSSFVGEIKRTSGARVPKPKAAMGGLRTLRDLRGGNLERDG